MRSTASITLATLISLLASNRSAADERSAVVRIGGCTAFNVSPDGMFLTAKHCRPPEAVTIAIDGQEVRAVRAYVSSEKEGPVVFRASPPADGLPFLPLAAGPPEIGDAVYSLGYPGGNWARIEGKIVGGVRLEGVTVNVTDHRIATGNSGGPLLNARGEVIGIASGVDPDLDVHRSYWISFAATKEAVDAVAGGHTGRTDRWPEPPAANAGRPVLLCFTTPGCLACERFKLDYYNPLLSSFRRAIDGAWTLDVVSTATPAGAEKARRHDVDEFPTFVPSNRPDVKIVGYRGRSWLLGELARYGPPANRDPQPADPADVDWSDVTIVVLVPEQDVGYIRGKVRERALSLAIGPLRRKLAELTDGKSRLEIVAERTNPSRYRAVTEAAGLPTGEFALLALVARQEAGLLKGLILKRLERIAVGKLEDAPLDVIFERAHRDDYRAITAALLVEEQPEEPEPDSPIESPAPEAGLTQTLLQEGFERLTDRLARIEAKPAPTPENDEDQPHTPWTLHVIAAALSLLGLERITAAVRAWNAARHG